MFKLTLTWPKKFRASCLNVKITTEFQFKKNTSSSQGINFQTYS